MFEQALVIQLSTISGLSGKVFPIQAEQGTLTPYLTYSLGSVDREKELNGYNNLNAFSYQFDLISNTYSALKTLMKSLTDKLKTLEGQTVGRYIQEIEIQTELINYIPESNLYDGIIEVIFYYQED